MYLLNQEIQTQLPETNTRRETHSCARRAEFGCSCHLGQWQQLLHDPSLLLGGSTHPHPAAGTGLTRERTRLRHPRAPPAQTPEGRGDVLCPLPKGFVQD